MQGIYFISEGRYKTNIPGDFVNHISYSQLYANPDYGEEKLRVEAKSQQRVLSSKLLSRASVIRFYDFWAKLNFIPSRSNIRTAYIEILHISERLHGQFEPIENVVSAVIIRKQLKLDTVFKAELADFDPKKYMTE